MSWKRGFRGSRWITAAAMDDGRPKRAEGAWGGTLLFCCALQFVVLTIAAMWMYPGGAKYVLGGDHYLFFSKLFQ